jgi:hypothetical protein
MDEALKNDKVTQPVTPGEVEAQTENILDPNQLKEKFKTLEAELQKTLTYLNTQIDSIEEYEEPSRIQKKFRDAIYFAKKSMVEQKINTMRTLLSLYVEEKKDNEGGENMGKDITSFLN